TLLGARSTPTSTTPTPFFARTRQNAGSWNKPVGRWRTTVWRWIYEGVGAHALSRGVPRTPACGGRATLPRQASISRAYASRGALPGAASGLGREPLLLPN